VNARQRQAWKGLSRSSRWRWTTKRVLGRCFEGWCLRRGAVSAKIGPTGPAGTSVTEVLVELRYCCRHAAEVAAAVIPAAESATLEYESGARVTVPLAETEAAITRNNFGEGTRHVLTDVTEE
jgi:hypothetical protein